MYLGLSAAVSFQGLGPLDSIALSLSNGKHSEEIKHDSIAVDVRDGAARKGGDNESCAPQMRREMLDSY